MDEQKRQAALDALHILDTPADERLDRVTRLAKELLDVPIVALNFIDHDRQWTKSQIGLGPVKDVRRDDSICQHTVASNSLFMIEDTHASPDFAAHPAVTGPPYVRFYAGHPVHAPGGQPVGALCAIDTRPRQFSDHQLDLLRDLALWMETELGRECLTEEVDAARLLSMSHECPQIPGYTIAADSTAHVSLSGDFYDLTGLPGSLRVTLADAMGSGIGAALVAAGVRASLRTEPERPLIQAMTDADRILHEDFAEKDMFVTAVHANVELATGKIELVDAGHGLAFVIGADTSWRPLRSVNLPLGMNSAVAGDYKLVTDSLAPGEHLVCCSDGLLDVLDPADPFGHVERVIRELGPEQAIARVADLALDARATDDITAIVIRRDA
ncbi:PP2C family protein-serine/threonine phosphatase [Corynebacterium guangdongense]|uniref:PPM-type phosphatase domain-containing protein n=1 Tax=Corynebacterium guangdongense TaxID=1783348 RepID=A0ABU1ZXJ9_9CORY|nr:GAF domain-containing SpoIIE family protein phosphatase [Corynebacterium guangdongense]MDR7329656.1 hypothetical protein [Corynebacterium guangdongense]